MKVEESESGAARLEKAVEVRDGQIGELEGGEEGEGGEGRVDE